MGIHDFLQMVKANSWIPGQKMFIFHQPGFSEKYGEDFPYETTFF